jgi:hypothetical protein
MPFLKELFSSHICIWRKPLLKTVGLELDEHEHQRVYGKNNNNLAYISDYTVGSLQYKMDLFIYTISNELLFLF